MPKVQYSTKLTPEQVEALQNISEKTHIPQAVLVRQAIDIFIETLGKSAVSRNFLSLVKKKVREDKELLKRLAGL